MLYTWLPVLTLILRKFPELILRSAFIFMQYQYVFDATESLRITLDWELLNCKCYQI